MHMAHLLCPLSKHKEHSVNNVGLAASIGPHHRGEALQANRAVSTIQFSQVSCTEGNVKLDPSVPYGTVPLSAGQHRI